MFLRRGTRAAVVVVEVRGGDYQGELLFPLQPSLLFPLQLTYIYYGGCMFLSSTTIQSI